MSRAFSRLRHTGGGAPATPAPAGNGTPIKPAAPLGVPTVVLDANYQKRADDLIEDAKVGANKRKVTTAVKGYFRAKDRADWIEMGATVLTGVGITVLCVGLVAAGVPTYGATFIIGPVLAVIAGVAIKKTKKEVSYYF